MVTRTVFIEEPNRIGIRNIELKMGENDIKEKR